MTVFLYIAYSIVGLWAVGRLMRHAALGAWYLPDENVRYQPPEDFDD